MDVHGFHFCPNPEYPMVMCCLNKFHFGPLCFAQKLSLPFLCFIPPLVPNCSLIEWLDVCGVLSSVWPASGSDTFCVSISPTLSLLLAQLFDLQLFTQSMNIMDNGYFPRFLKTSLMYIFSTCDFWGSIRSLCQCSLIFPSPPEEQFFCLLLSRDSLSILALFFSNFLEWRENFGHLPSSISECKPLNKDSLRGDEGRLQREGKGGRKEGKVAWKYHKGI